MSFAEIQDEELNEYIAQQREPKADGEVKILRFAPIRFSASRFLFDDSLFETGEPAMSVAGWSGSRIWFGHYTRCAIGRKFSVSLFQIVSYDKKFDRIS